MNEPNEPTERDLTLAEQIDTIPVLDVDQRARAHALTIARDVCKTTGFASAKVDSTTDLIELADYITTGHLLPEPAQAASVTNIFDRLDAEREAPGQPVIGVVLPEGTAEPDSSQMESIRDFTRLVIEQGAPGMFAFYRHDEMTLAVMMADLNQHLEHQDMNTSRSEAKIAACLVGWLNDRVLVPEVARMEAEQSAFKVRSITATGASGAAYDPGSEGGMGKPATAVPSRDPLSDAAKNDGTCPGGC